ncbi:hypothetical protein ZWY2020_032858 [Hordeum vulgare]|nr:hypothetical protein ZWY2020_032858 [Hordeum vulgare]
MWRLPAPITRFATMPDRPERIFFALAGGGATPFESATRRRIVPGRILLLPQCSSSQAGSNCCGPRCCLGATRPRPIPPQSSTLAGFQSTAATSCP